jgi:multiple antibiotic resistance protein
VALSILIILVVSAFVGLRVLGVFGISLDVFQVVGGIIIAYMGFDMLGGGQKIAQAPPSSGEGTDRRNSLAPLIMFAAGPGTITAVVTLAAVHSPAGLPLSALAAAAAGAGVTFVVLLLVTRLGSRISPNTQAIVTRFMGLIVTAMGMQFVLTGLKAFMHA